MRESRAKLRFRSRRYSISMFRVRLFLSHGAEVALFIFCSVLTRIRALSSHSFTGNSLVRDRG